MILIFFNWKFSVLFSSLHLYIVDKIFHQKIHSFSIFHSHSTALVVSSEFLKNKCNQKTRRENIFVYVTQSVNRSFHFHIFIFFISPLHNSYISTQHQQAYHDEIYSVAIFMLISYLACLFRVDSKRKLWKYVDDGSRVKENCIFQEEKNLEKHGENCEKSKNEIM